MPNYTENMIDALTQGNATEFADNFNSQVRENIAKNIDEKRTEIAKSLFNKEEE